ncbi:MAG: hypothetical protein CR217_15495 [Beijerinckiaceae bacterium]|nr:MAG: hypothetical protein CR217_15495 [Beijerinckiaceae bacterium]
MGRAKAFFGLLAAAVGWLAAVSVGLVQILPKPLQDWFNGKVAEVAQAYLENDCQIGGGWTQLRGGGNAGEARW